MKGTAWTAKITKVKCKDCKYNDYWSCNKFPEVRDKFTGNIIKWKIRKEELNSNGLCVHYRKKNWLERILK